MERDESQQGSRKGQRKWHMKYQDIADHDEDTRIEMIGKKAMTGQTVAFITDADPGKADRYIAKLLKKFPGLKVLARFDGPIKGVVTVKVCCAGEN